MSIEFESNLSDNHFSQYLLHVVHSINNRFKENISLFRQICIVNTVTVYRNNKKKTRFLLKYLNEYLVMHISYPTRPPNRATIKYSS